ncbi:MAG: hypothetical protein RML93_11500 [Anaerolineales bacterium]|nr:hypothetical protein [Anaerolineales bacterium]MCS7248654.1 hypothetical protein [Anaerolineales bacterium]MDW8162467.1 hypothetical protein [Anaerolineales bacterium]MDW8447902.1 hypothetical protein [Anaerolineales bacterium]
MAVKLLMTWDILPAKEQEYFEFMVREFIPGIERLGLEPSDAWFTVYGNHPQIMAAIRSSTLSRLQQVLNSPDWQRLTEQLLNYVEELKYKVVEDRPGFQL